MMFRLSIPEQVYADADMADIKMNLKPYCAGKFRIIQAGSHTGNVLYFLETLPALELSSFLISGLPL